MKVYKIIKYILLAIGFVGSESLAVFWFIKIWKYLFCSPEMIQMYDQYWGWISRVNVFLGLWIPAGLLFVLMPGLVICIINGIMSLIEKLIIKEQIDSLSD